MNTRTLRTVIALLGCTALGYLLATSEPLPQAFAQPLSDVTAFSQDWQAITPHDTTPLPRQPRAIMIAADGAVSMLGWQDEGTSCVPMALFAGVVYPLSPRLICDTGTDATSVLAIY